MDDAATPAKYRHVWRAVTETPWAILRETHAAIMDTIALRVQGGAWSDEELAERIEAARSTRPAQMQGSIAVIPISGVIMPRATLFSDISGGTSMQGFMDTLRAAVNDPNVSGILLEVDSPGGLVDLVPEAAAEIRAARAQKPVVAVANTTAASAAYWLAAQADEFYVTPSGEVGSVGVFMAHDDLSAMAQMAGVKRTYISAGDSPYKTEGNPFEALSEDAATAMQATVDEVMGMFVADVAAGRRVSADAVLSDFGQGRMLTASNAAGARMVDGVKTFDGALARVAVLASGGQSRIGAKRIDVEIMTGPPEFDTPKFEAALGEAARRLAELSPTEATENGGNNAALVDGAERLLARPSFRSAVSGR